MSDTVPVSLFLTRRALCPGCGAPLQIDPAKVAVDCEYCGCECGIERRLRFIEAQLVQGTGLAALSRGRPAFTPAHALTGEASDHAACPGCGRAIEMAPEQELAECTYCGSRSMVERRLVHGDDPPCDEAAQDAELAAFSTADHTDFEERTRKRNEALGKQRYVHSLDDLRNDHYLCVLLTASDEATLLDAAQRFSYWRRMNTWRECMYTRLLRHVGSLPTNVAELAYERIESVARAPWQSGDHRLRAVRAVVRAASRVLYRPDAPQELSYRLATGQPGAMLKLMLDVAEWAVTNGDEPAAERVLNSTARALDFRERFGHVWRDRVDPELLAEIMMYRLLYMPTRLVAWALEQVPRWQLQDYRVLVRFVDDCVYERPDLIAAIRDARIAHTQPAKTFREYFEHLRFLETLATPAAREYGMYLFTHDARNTAPDEEPGLLAGILRRLLEMQHTPELRKHAGWMMAHFIRIAARRELPAVHAFVHEHRDDLPAIAWWAYRHAVPTVEVPESASLELPYQAPQTFHSPMVDELRGFSSHHSRENEHMREEQRREVADRESAKALELAQRKLEVARREREAWHPGRAARGWYRRALRKLREAGDKAHFASSAPALYAHERRISAHWIEYEQTRDPRYKDYLERHQACYDALLETARLDRARNLARAYAKKSLLGRLMHRLRGKP